MRSIPFDNDGYNWLRLWAFMIYPDKETERLELEVKQRLLCDLESKKPDETVQVPVTVLRAILKTDSVFAITAIAIEHSNRATIAGDVLYYHAKLESLLNEGSLRKAIFLTGKIHQTTEKSKQAAKKLKAGLKERTLWNYINEFSPVLHYWAARATLKHFPQFLDGQSLTEEFRNTGLPHNDSELELFIAIAQWYQNYAINYKTKHVRETEFPLFPDNAYNVFADNQAPLEFELNFGAALTDTEKTLLDQYKHHDTHFSPRTAAS